MTGPLDLDAIRQRDASDDTTAQTRAVLDRRALLAEVDRLQRAAETLGSIVSRNAEDICRIANVPMPEDGDADYALAWDRVAGMPGEIARLNALLSARDPHNDMLGDGAS